MELKLSTIGDVSKNMKTSRNKKEGQIVTCGIAVKAVRVNRDQAAQLAGVPIETITGMFDELGAPFQRMSFLLPKRVLRAKGKIELRGDSGAAVATIDIALAAAGDFRFNLDVPDDQGPTVMSSFTLLWKAHGDEVEDLGPLLDNSCFVTLEFTDENGTKELFPSSPASPSLEAAAGHRAKLDRKRQAAGEKPSDNDPIEPASEIRYAPGNGETASAAQKSVDDSKVVKIGEGKKKVTSLAQLKREAEEHAKKHPRRDPPRTPPNNKGKR